MRGGERVVGMIGGNTVRMFDSSLPANDELPDATLPTLEREELKRIVASFEASHSDHALMYLANAFEAAAFRKRGL